MKNNYLISARLKLVFLTFVTLYISFIPFWNMSDEQGDFIGRLFELFSHFKTNNSVDVQSVYILFYAPFISSLLYVSGFVATFFVGYRRLIMVFNMYLFLLIGICVSVGILLKDFPNIAFLVAVFYWVIVDIKKILLHETHT